MNKPLPDKVLRSDRIVLDIGRNEVLLDRVKIPLRAKPLRLLHEFMSHPGELLTKAHFNETVWEGRPHSDAVLTTAIKELRAALGDDSRKPWAIETVHGLGYRFLPEIVTGDDAAPQSNEPEGTSGQWPTITISSALLIALLAVWLWTRGDDAGEAVDTAIESIAVLPFEDLSQSGDLHWFAHGISEEMLNSLVRIPGLNVAARTSATQLAGRGATVEELGRALGVSHVIEGSVRKDAGSDLRVTAQLIRVKDGFHVWSSTWDRNLTPAASLEIQRDVADQVMAMMAPDDSLLAVDLQQSPPLPDSAWEKLLRGRELVDRRSRDSISAGLGLLHEVSNAFPDNADGHAALAAAYIYAGEANALTPQAALKAAGLHAERAMLLDGDNTGALLAGSLLAMVNRDAQRSLELADRALGVSPGLAQAYHRRGVALAGLGQLDEARSAFRQAMLRDPLSPTALLQYGVASLRGGFIDDAYEAAAQNLRWNPQSHLATGFVGELSLQVGDYRRAMACLRASLLSSEEHAYAATSQGELLWRLGSFEQLATLQTSSTAAYAAGLFSQGDTASAVEVASGIPWFRRNSLTPLDILLWSQRYDEALPLAERFVSQFGDIDLVTGPYPLPDDTLPAYRVLRHHDHARVEQMSERLAARYTALKPEDAQVFSELFSGLSWHTLQGNTEEALDWLSVAAERGMILPELKVDPLFKPLMDSPKAVTALEQMERRATTLRADLDTGQDC